MTGSRSRRPGQRSAPDFASRRGRTAAAAGRRRLAYHPLTGAFLIVLAGVAAYHGSLGGPLIFDDLSSIVDNPSLRDLGDLRATLTPSIAPRNS